MLFSRLRRWFTGNSLSSAPDTAARGFQPRVETLEDRIVPAWTVTDLSATTPAAMVQNLVGAGITVKNISYTGATQASGTFTDTSNVTGIKAGIILSSGSAAGIAGPNSSGSSGTGTGAASDAQLDAIIAPQLGYDASVLQFNFVPKGSILSFQYVFGSDEYPEFVNSINDVFAFFLDGKNVALVPGTNQAVSINNVNDFTNSKYYVDNNTNPTAYDTQMDGFTKVLTVSLAVTPGRTYNIKLAIEDASDSIYDSWVMIKAGSLSAPHVVAYSPLRFVYQASTGLFLGNLSVVNYSPSALAGPLYLLFPSLPAGVKLTNATGKTKSGVPYIKIGGVAGNTALTVGVKFLNPLRSNLGSFFYHHTISIAAAVN